MLSSRLIRLARLDRLDRERGVPDRAVALAFAGRAADEVLSGAWTVLWPTFRRTFRLSLVQLGWLSQVLTWVALVIEPVAASAIDFWGRRALLCSGAVAVAVAVLVMGAAPTYAVLLVGFGLYGLGSGSLTQTADVVVVECFPRQADRAYTRATFLDTIGALLGPGAVAVAAAAGLSWRVLLVGLGAVALLYAWSLSTTTFPRPAGTPEEGQSVARTVVGNVRTVLRDAMARRWLRVLLWHELFDAAFVLEYVWLNEVVGLSQPAVAVWAAAERAVDLVALLLLDRWLRTGDGERIFRLAATALVVLPAAWVAAPGIPGRIVVGIPLAFTHALLWPLAKARSLASAPLPGAVQAVSTLFPVIPFALLGAWFAGVAGMGMAMAATATGGALLMRSAVCGRGS